MGLRNISQARRNLPFEAPLLRVSGQLSPEKNCPRLGLVFESRLGLVLELGATRQLSPKKIAPPRSGLGFGLGLVLGLGRNFPGAIVLEPLLKQNNLKETK